MIDRTRAVSLGMICVALIGIGSGCAGRQLVSSDVPLRRVVLYRNGVGYFERAGVVEGETLTFQVRREHVGDFLATLAVIDTEGHARSVSFPSLETDEDVAEAGCECELNDDGEMECEEPPEEEEDNLVDVVLEFTGDDHNLVIAYVVETPNLAALLSSRARRGERPAARLGGGAEPLGRGLG